MAVSCEVRTVAPRRPGLLRFTPVRRLGTGLPLALGLVFGSTDVAASESPRWPRWPTEVDRAAAPLRKNGEQLSPDPERVDAVLSLEAFATPVIEPWIL